MVERTETPDLPDQGDAPVTLVWDFEGTEGDAWAVLRIGDRVIWRKKAWFECLELLRDAANELFDRYEGQIADIIPAEGTGLYLWGDDYGAPGRVNGVRRRVRRKHRAWLKRRVATATEEGT